ncbi:MAG: DUF4388 domain-containing protein [Actinomycetia bacterium]|nr:DUF4388 domain-containing protein [Actinomycetes bacterium]
MKLEGSLDAFSLPDVFQLLSLTKKSGGLHLTNGQVSGSVYFADGMVTGAVSDISRQALARRLVGLGAADDAALRRAVERAANEGAGIARALVEAGSVDGSLVQRLALEQAVDAVFDLLRWPNGDFAFGMGEENPDDVGLVVTAEQIVGEATTRRESWEALSRLIPSPDVVLTMPVVLPENTTLDRDEWALLALIDGTRSVGDLVEISGAGQYPVVSTLATLIQRGLLVLRDEESPDHVSLVMRRQQLLAPLEFSAAPPASAQAGLPDVHIQARGVPQGAVALDATIPATAGGPLAPAAPVPPVMPPSVPAGVPAPAAAAAAPGMLPGAHDPANIVPPRPEPFLPKRDVDYPEPVRAPGFAAPAASTARAPVSAPPGAPPGMAGALSGGIARGASGVGVATAAAPAGDSAIERDPTVNRSLMLRLIAGVRGL